MKANRDTNRLRPSPAFAQLAHVNQHLDKIWRSVIQTLGFCLIFFYLGLVLMVLYGFFYDVCRQYHIVYQSYLLTMVIELISISY